MPSFGPLHPAPAPYRAVIGKLHRRVHLGIQTVHSGQARAASGRIDRVRLARGEIAHVVMWKEEPGNQEGRNDASRKTTALLPSASRRPRMTYEVMGPLGDTDTVPPKPFSRPFAINGAP